MRVAWYNSETLTQMITVAKLAGELSQSLTKLTRLDLIVIDDLGILPIGLIGSEAIYRVIEAAYEKTSVIVTSNDNGHEKFPTYVENISSTNYRKVVQICLQSRKKFPVQRAGHSNVAGSHKYVPTGGINDK